MRPPVHACTVPSSVAKMNLAKLVPPGVTGKVDAPLNTTPVGPPATATVSATLAPVVPLYRVEVSVPLLDTHHGVAGPETMPQPFTRLASVASDWSTLTR